MDRHSNKQTHKQRHKQRDGKAGWLAEKQAGRGTNNALLKLII